MARCTVVRECCIVEPVSSDRQAILSPYLTYNSAPQFEIFVFIIIEVCPSPPFNIIMSGVQVQFEFYSVFRKRLGKIADQIPGTGTTRKNLINYFVGTWKIELGVGSRKYDIASTHFHRVHRQTVQRQSSVRSDSTPKDFPALACFGSSSAPSRRTWPAPSSQSALRPVRPERQVSLAPRA